MSHFAKLTVFEGRQLLDLARLTLEQVVRHQGVPSIRGSELSKALCQPTACFVSLTHQERLRGCIGHLIARHPLHQGVIDNTRSAAMGDPRFRPLQVPELEGVRIEISVLTELQPLAFESVEELPGLLRPHEDGVVLHLGDQLTTFLPQVWSQIPDPLDFLDRLAQKAGGDPTAWRQPRVGISIYQVEAFAESA